MISSSQIFNLKYKLIVKLPSNIGWLEGFILVRRISPISNSLMSSHRKIEEPEAFLKILYPPHEFADNIPILAINGSYRQLIIPQSDRVGVASPNSLHREFKMDFIARIPHGLYSIVLPFPNYENWILPRKLLLFTADVYTNYFPGVRRIFKCDLSIIIFGEVG